MNLGNSLFHARKKRGLSQEEVAQKIGVSRQTISKWETNETIPDIYQSKKMAKLYNVSTEYVDDLLKRVGLYDHRKTLAEKLSTGMKQRMLLVRAIINKPKVLFLDEPTSGLDPSTSQTIHSLIEELKQQGTTIFLTTHDMHEATILCDKIVLLNKGKIVEEGKPAELIQKYNTNKMVKVTYCSGQEKVIPFSELNHISATQDIQTIHSCEPTLEDIFIQLTGGKLNV